MFNDTGNTTDGSSNHRLIWTAFADHVSVSLLYAAVGKWLTSTRLHGLSCLKSAGHHSRHDSLNESVRRARDSRATRLLREDGLRRDGKTMIPWKNGKELVRNVTVVDTLAKSYVSKTTGKVGTAAEDAEERKIQKYQGIASQYLFIPLVTGSNILNSFCTIMQPTALWIVYFKPDEE
ncbi:hypothetical protein RvY_16755 [Ramazzottius varieornatus]|uniref:Uncharacterized protein n=1 Tax=Ramazzottius varieornatus TaxID=947166 RepID=A0A1D1W5W2_RAMVA|nr:hypothetical protein RvY_16755 [Ramazzottius varieornatus]